MDFSLSDDHRLVQESIRRWAEKELAPVADRMDREGRYPLDLHRRLAQEGFLGAVFPKEYGGGGADLLTFALIKEELAHASAGFAVSFGASTMFFGWNVLELGTEAQKRRYLPGLLRGETTGAWALTEPNTGSDALSIQTTAVREGDGYVLNGSKNFITNAPFADHFLVLARTPGHGSGKLDGGTALVVDRNTPGLTIGAPIEKFGIRCSPFAPLFFDHARVPADQLLGKEGEGFREMLRCLDTERATAPFTSVGIARAALEASVAYAKQRRQFGRPIAEFQLVQEKIARMAEGIELARTYGYRVIWMKEHGMRITQEAAIAKRFASRMAVEAAWEAMQIHGGYGYTTEVPIERLVRDAKADEIGGGTSEIQTLIIAREALKK